MKDVLKQRRERFAAMGKLGGQARAASTTAAERRLIAKLGAQARWARWRESKAEREEIEQSPMRRVS